MNVYHVHCILYMHKHNIILWRIPSDEHLCAKYTERSVDPQPSITANERGKGIINESTHCILIRTWTAGIEYLRTDRMETRAEKGSE